MEDQIEPKRRGRPRAVHSALDPADILDISPELTADLSLHPEASSKPANSTTPDATKDPEGYAAYVAELRQKRKPYGAQMQKLALPGRAGYKRHWFNDVGGRVQEYMDNGWSKVLDQKGSPIVRTVGTARDSSPLKAYALEIPSVFWQEVEDERHAIAKARMDDIKSSPIRAERGAAKASDSGKFYSPREEIISVSETLSRR